MLVPPGGEINFPISRAVQGDLGGKTSVLPQHYIGVPFFPQWFYPGYREVNNFCSVIL